MFILCGGFIEPPVEMFFRELTAVVLHCSNSKWDVKGNIKPMGVSQILKEFLKLLSNFRTQHCSLTKTLERNLRSAPVWSMNPDPIFSTNYLQFHWGAQVQSYFNAVCTIWVKTHVVLLAKDPRQHPTLTGKKRKWFSRILKCGRGGRLLTGLTQCQVVSKIIQRNPWIKN